MNVVVERVKELAQTLADFTGHDFFAWTSSNFLTGSLLEWIATLGTTFAVVLGAEIGDKSQIVCMSLAARHRGLPVLLGATCAFALLNLAAVSFGAAVAVLVPEKIVSIAVAILFTTFGIHALLAAEDEEVDNIEKSGHGIFAATFILVFVAEFGDKTQIAVAGLSSALVPAAVWLGATLALSFTSALGVWAGRTVFQQIPIALMHRIGGVIFLALSGFAIAHVVSIP